MRHVCFLARFVFVAATLLLVHEIGMSPVLAQSPSTTEESLSRKDGRPRSSSTRLYTVSALGGAAFGSTTELEGRLKRYGFNDFVPGGTEYGLRIRPTEYPITRGGQLGLIDLHRRVARNLNIGGLAAVMGTRTTGKDGLVYMSLSNVITTYAPVVSVSSGLVRLGVGPAWHRIEIRRDVYDRVDRRHYRRPGVVIDLALTFPKKSKYYLDVRAQYRAVGSVEMGPYEERRDDRVYRFPASDVSLDHRVLAAGVGMRF